MTQTYPLQWPEGRPRTPGRDQRSAKFNEGGLLVSKSHALKRLRHQVRMLGAEPPVVSTMIELRRDGTPRRGRRAPEDTGVAVYFDLTGEQFCLACDHWDRIADNIVAIAKHIEASRGQERWGVATAKDTFAGFKALPAPGTKEWHLILEVPANADRKSIDAAYRALARERHPDQGGSDAMMADLNAAYDQAKKAANG